MSHEFEIYAVFTTLAVFAAAAFIGLKSVRDPSRFSGWYLALYATTYIIKPAGGQFVHDRFMYDWLGVHGFESVWFEMTVGVSLAALCYALGYRLGGVRFRPATPLRKAPAPVPESRSNSYYYVAIGLIGWGYLSQVISVALGWGVTRVDDAWSYGVAENGTFWLMASDLFVSTGATLLFILTARPYLSLGVAAPWVLQRIYLGHGRINVIGFLISMTVVHLIVTKRSPKLGNKLARVVRNVVFGVLAAFYVLVIFPAAKISRDYYFVNGLSVESILEVWRLNTLTETWFATNSDIFGFETTAYFFEVSEQPELGVIYLYMYVIKPIPRMLWSGKPFPDVLLKDLRGIVLDSRYFGFAAGCVGMAYEQWGWLGIPLEFCLTGWIFSRLERWVKQGNSPPHALLTYAGFFSLIPQLGRDSLFIMIADRWLFVYGIPVFLLWGIRRLSARRPRPRAAALAHSWGR